MSNENFDLAYSLGFNISSQLKSDFGDLDVAGFHQAMQDVFAGKAPSIANEQMQVLIQTAQMKAQQAKQAQQAEQGEKNHQLSAEYLAEMAKKEGVQTTESGLMYEVLTAGDGHKPSETDSVTVHYHGMLPNGQVFDSSVERGQPATFGLNQVIKGWTEGVQLMPTGAKYRFYIPSELAYGEQGAGASIGPNQALVFDVELLSIG